MITPDEFLKHAESIIVSTNNPQEIEFRSAVSRAYYSLYHEAYDKISQNHKSVLVHAICEYLDRTPDQLYVQSRIQSLDRNYLKTQRVNLHQTIPLVLKRINKKNEGLDFIGFRNNRNDADYDIRAIYSNDNARVIVGQIRKLIQKINQI